jgi:hypothetical protein
VKPSSSVQGDTPLVIMRTTSSVYSHPFLTPRSVDEARIASRSMGSRPHSNHQELVRSTAAFVFSELPSKLHLWS